MFILIPELIHLAELENSSNGLLCHTNPVADLLRIVYRTLKGLAMQYTRHINRFPVPFRAHDQVKGCRFRLAESCGPWTKSIPSFLKEGYHLDVPFS